MIHNEGLAIPAVEQLVAAVGDDLASHPGRAAAAADLLAVARRFELASGWMSIPHRWKQYSVQAGAYRMGVPFTGHPMIGHDIIYNHPMNHCACLGRTAERDFLAFAESVSRLEGGAYISIGSAVMSPMVLKKLFRSLKTWLYSEVSISTITISSSMIWPSRPGTGPKESRPKTTRRTICGTTSRSAAWEV